MGIHCFHPTTYVKKNRRKDKEIKQKMHIMEKDI